ncbi:MAG: hypothetical protein Q9164_000745 [Protoblastenia rupestris]
MSLALRHLLTLHTFLGVDIVPHALSHGPFSAYLSQASAIFEDSSLQVIPKHIRPFRRRHLAWNEELVPSLREGPTRRSPTIPFAFQFLRDLDCTQGEELVIYSTRENADLSRFREPGSGILAKLRGLRKPQSTTWKEKTWRARGSIGEFALQQRPSVLPRLGYGRPGQHRTPAQLPPTITALAKLMASLQNFLELPWEDSDVEQKRITTHTPTASPFFSSLAQHPTSSLSQ